MNKKFLTLGSHIREKLSEIRRSTQSAEKDWSLAFRTNRDGSYLLTCQEQQERKVKQVRNHIHLLMKEGDKPIGNTFRRIGASPKKH